MRRSRTLTYAWRALLASLLLLSGCSREKPPEAARDGAPEVTALDLERMHDDEKLLLFERLPLGASSGQVRQLLPALGELRPEGPGLTDATVEFDFLGHRTRLEVNFKDEVLYSVDAVVSNLSTERGQAMFEQLTEFYTRRFGPPVVDDGQDSPYYVLSRSWPLADVEIGFIMSLTGNRRMIGWGYQRPLSLKRRP